MLDAWIDGMQELWRPGICRLPGGRGDAAWLEVIWLIVFSLLGQTSPQPRMRAKIRKGKRGKAGGKQPFQTGARDGPMGARHAIEATQYTLS